VVKGGVPLLLIVGLVLMRAPLSAQSISGHWEGYLIQDQQEDTFRYELVLTQEGNAVRGTSRSISPEGKEARFSVTGLWRDKQLKIQEVEQLEPSSPRWCRKFAILSLERDQYQWKLRGAWQADGCRPGTLFLTLQSFTGHQEASLPFSVVGDWKGELLQSDRDYGFYFELQLKEGGAGTSYIVSEGNGGWARHALAWEWHPQDSSLRFGEKAVSQKSDARWPWCIKKGALRLQKESGRYVLSGSWQGYIEGYDPTNGACAPGRLRLEKPALPQGADRKMPTGIGQYTGQTQRAVNVQRILDVRSQTIRVKVWDNGIADGDVLTLYLNGQRVLDEYRVTKQRYAIPVELERGENMLVLHAIDLGNISPNTVAVAVDDGHQEQTIILSSNLDESGGVLIRYFEFH